MFYIFQSLLCWKPTSHLIDSREMQLRRNLVPPAQASQLPVQNEARSARHTCPQATCTRPPEPTMPSPAPGCKTEKACHRKVSENSSSITSSPSLITWRNFSLLNRALKSQRLVPQIKIKQMSAGKPKWFITLSPQPTSSPCFSHPRPLVSVLG